MWCRQRSLWDQEWNSIVFSDESRFCLGMHDGRARVRRRRGERRNPQFFVERHVHHTVGVMVWGAIAYGSKSPLIFIRGNMNAQRYIHEVLEPHLLPYLDTLADPTFQQDNARPHAARVTIDFFQHNDVTLLPWPPRSPDLSPIEHVWDMMGRRLLNLQRPPQTLGALREELVVAWNEILQEDIDHLIRSMPRRVGECVAHQEHFRAIIYYNFQRQLSQQECLAELLSVFGNEAPHQSTISRWYGEFKRGRVSLSDDSRVGAPKPVVTQENVDAVRKLIIEDRHVTYREIEASLKISKTSIQKNLHEELGVRKLVSRWIPHLVNWCQKTLDRFNFVNVYSIVNGDKSWIYCYEPENKRQSAVWVFQGEEKPTKVIRSRSVSKKVVTTFVSKAGHIATIPLNVQRTDTADWYTTICLPKVITELRKINPQRRIILRQDNASSHTAQKTRQYLTEENVELLHHPPYSPDLSPNDFFTFPKIKNRLRVQRFQSPEEGVDAFKNAWCRQRSLWDQEWNSIVFSDESRFCLGMHDGRARVRRRRGERRNPQFFVERHVCHTVGLMVWGAIAHGSRSPLIFIRGNMNAQRYIHEVLEPHLLPYLDTLADPTFQQDNARPHVARVTIDFFQHNDVTLLPWPPRSPDLSPIEHVWDMMGRRLLNLQRPPQTLEALREELVVAWNEIPQEDIDHLIRSMPRRVGECVAHQGASTHY
ncbi:unnamed protein product [Acanthoscelides obtectus]|uniref:Transposase n=1 Tax=Acanthoscelides obtectus TaxID=200917 RepID=A0A9P0KTH6_ACAOB|nr:unnamed protein product [Acanthoscelides obtectus]CAK1675110.1 Transposable element Tc3 transposase [Acanthoscelides obtectus]